MQRLGGCRHADVDRAEHRARGDEDHDQGPHSRGAERAATRADAVRARPPPPRRRQRRERGREDEEDDAGEGERGAGRPDRSEAERERRAEDEGQLQGDRLDRIGRGKLVGVGQHPGQKRAQTRADRWLRYPSAALYRAKQRVAAFFLCCSA